jgi:mannitol/fructose-specific phosphotransferase system IIA component (Ntr-type)
MRLSDYLREDFVLLGLHAREVEGVLHELAVRAHAIGLGERALIEERLLERERAHPTTLGEGLAIPHATVPGLGSTVVGVARGGGEPVDYGGGARVAIRVFFVLLSPPDREGEHVKLLARICRLVRHKGFLDDLEAAPDAAAVVRIIHQVDAQHV